MTKCIAPTVLSNRVVKYSQVKSESGDLCVERVVRRSLGGTSSTILNYSIKSPQITRLTYLCFVLFSIDNT